MSKAAASQKLRQAATADWLQTRGLMHTLLHPLTSGNTESIEVPDVHYVGQCPQTGKDLLLRPDPQAILEAEALKDYLRSIRHMRDGINTRFLYAPAFGKMFGVMVCKRPNGELGVLHAFSGEWENRTKPPGWVPSSSHIHEYEQEREETESLLFALTARIEVLKTQAPSKGRDQTIAGLKAQRRKLSRDLTDKIHDAYRFDNVLGEELPLTQVDTGSPRPPTGMGDCCAPKLLQCAIRSQLEPVSMVEFWWGTSPPVHTRIEGNYYSSCEHKCYPILGFMLRGVPSAEVRP